MLVILEEVQIFTKGCQSLGHNSESCGASRDAQLLLNFYKEREMQLADFTINICFRRACSNQGKKLEV